MYNVYISASTQKENKGVLNYGTEDERMHELADMVQGLLERQKNFMVFRNKLGWKLSETVIHANSMLSSIFIDLHSNAGTSGTESYFHVGSKKGKELATSLYNHTAKISQGKDHGVKVDTTIYKNGLYVLRTTKMAACLLEIIDHTNKKDVEHFLKNMEMYAVGIVKGICAYFKIDFIAPIVEKEKVKVVEYKTIGEKYLFEKGYTKSRHDPLEIVDFGTLGIIFKNYDKINRCKKK